MNVRSVSKSIFIVSKIYYFELHANRLLFRILLISAVSVSFGRSIFPFILELMFQLFFYSQKAQVIETEVVPVHLLKSFDKVNQ